MGNWFLGSIITLCVGALFVLFGQEGNTTSWGMWTSSLIQWLGLIVIAGGVFMAGIGLFRR